MRKARKATRKTKRKPRLGMWKRKTRKGIRGKGDYNGREGKEDSKEKKGYLRLITQLPRQVCWTHFFYIPVFAFQQLQHCRARWEQ